MLHHTCEKNYIKDVYNNVCETRIFQSKKATLVGKIELFDNHASMTIAKAHKLFLHC